MSIDRLKDHWREQRMFLGRIIAAAVIVTLLAGLLMYRLVDLQVVHFEHFSRLSQGNRVRLEPVPPVRGLLFDRAGRPLAENQPVYQLELVPEQVKDLQATLDGLVTLGLVRTEDLPRIQSQIRSQRRFEPAILRARLSDEEAARFAVNRPRFTGVDIQARLARRYPLGARGAHAVGYVGAISEPDLRRLDTANYAGTAQTGKVGAERAYEDLLHGTTGFRQVLVNAQGRALQELERNDAVPGRNVYLTLDLELQAAAEDALGERRGAIVAHRPAQRPGAGARQHARLRPQPVQHGHPAPQRTGHCRKTWTSPCSTAPCAASTRPARPSSRCWGSPGCTHGITTPLDTMWCPGWFSLPNTPTATGTGNGKATGRWTSTDSIAQSCDVYFYRPGGRARHRPHARFPRFASGSAQPPGSTYPARSGGLLPSRDWKRSAFRRRAGPGLVPRRNRDHRHRPGLHAGHADAAGAGHCDPRQSRPGLPPHPAGGGRGPRERRCARNSTRSRCRRSSSSLRMSRKPSTPWWPWCTGERGTARAIGLDSPWTIAGKTGTAQVFRIAQDEEYDEDEVEERHRPHALFVGFAPAENPRIAIAVLVENGGSGSGAAAPIARIRDRQLARQGAADRGRIFIRLRRQAGRSAWARVSWLCSGLDAPLLAGLLAVAACRPGGACTARAARTRSC